MNDEREELLIDTQTLKSIPDLERYRIVQTYILVSENADPGIITTYHIGEDMGGETPVDVLHKLELIDGPSSSVGVDTEEDLLGAVTIRLWIKPITPATVFLGILASAITYKVLKS